jgi:hypothetical protein
MAGGTGAGVGVGVERGTGDDLIAGIGSGRPGRGVEEAGWLIMNPPSVNIVRRIIFLVFIFLFVVCSSPPRQSRPVLGVRTFLTEV